MAQSIFSSDRKIFTGTASSGGGTFVATITTSAAPFTDQLIRLFARIYTTAASGAHLNTSCALVAEYVVQNKNNTTTAVTAMTSSANPSNSGTATFVASRVEVADTTANTSSANWTLSSSNATLTVTNNGTSSVLVNVTIVVDIEYVGST